MPNEGSSVDFRIPTSPGVILFLSGGEWRGLEACFSTVEGGMKNAILGHNLDTGTIGLIYYQCYVTCWLFYTWLVWCCPGVDVRIM